MNQSDCSDCRVSRNESQRRAGDRLRKAATSYERQRQATKDSDSSSWWAEGEFAIECNRKQLLPNSFCQLFYWPQMLPKSISGSLESTRFLSLNFLFKSPDSP